MTTLFTRRRLGLVAALFLSMLAATSLLSSCATLNALAGLNRIQFKLNEVRSVRLAGIDLSNKHRVTDFGLMDAASLLSAFRSGRFPLTFTLNVLAKNPNKPNGASLNALQVTDLPWRLLLNGKETISGNIAAPVAVPPGGSTEVIPLEVSMDLKQFFADKGYDEIVELALALSGQGGVSQVQLKATPEMGTPIGRIRYPGELTIVSTQFSN